MRGLKSLRMVYIPYIFPLLLALGFGCSSSLGEYKKSPGNTFLAPKFGRKLRFNFLHAASSLNITRNSTVLSPATGVKKVLDYEDEDEYDEEWYEEEWYYRNESNAWTDFVMPISLSLIITLHFVWSIFEHLILPNCSCFQSMVNASNANCFSYKPPEHKFRRKLDALQGMRSLATLWILSEHYAGGGSTLFQYAHYRGMVPVCFYIVLSGFVTHYANYRRATSSVCEALRMVLKRFARVAPAYYFALLMCIYVPDPDAEETLYVSEVLFVQAWKAERNISNQEEDWWVGVNGPAWTMSVLAFSWVCYPLFALLLESAVKMAGRWGHIVAKVFALAFCLASVMIYVGAVDDAAMTESVMKMDEVRNGFMSAQYWRARLNPVYGAFVFIAGMCVAETFYADMQIIPNIADSTKENLDAENQNHRNCLLGLFVTEASWDILLRWSSDIAVALVLFSVWLIRPCWGNFMIKVASVSDANQYCYGDSYSGFCQSYLICGVNDYCTYVEDGSEMGMMIYENSVYISNPNDSSEVGRIGNEMLLETAFVPAFLLILYAVATVKKTPGKWLDGGIFLRFFQSEPLVSLGRATFIIYIFQAPAQAWWKACSKHYDTDWEFTAADYITFVLVFWILAWAFERWVETPFYKISCSVIDVIIVAVSGSTLPMDSATVIAGNSDVLAAQQNTTTFGNLRKEVKQLFSCFQPLQN